MDLNNLYEYLKQWKIQGTQNLPQYMRPGLQIQPDTETPMAGYHSLENPNTLFLNPNRLRDQYSGLETLFHESAHADQGPAMRLLRGAFTTPGWLTRSVDNFPYYDNSTNPNILEKLATMRADKAMVPVTRDGTKDWFETTIGKDVLDQARKKYGYPTNRAGYSDEQLKRMLLKEMFPEKSSQPDDDTGSWMRSLSDLFRH